MVCYGARQHGHFYLNAAIISASTGSSAVRAAAYRHAVRMVSHAFTETTSFTHKAQAMVHAEVALPEDAPEWAENAFGHAAFADALRLVRADVQAQGSDMSEAAMQRAAMARVSERLWNAVEHGEIRLNIFPTRAQYARSLIVALPRELDQAAQIALMQGYVRASLSDRGMVADWVIHDKSDGNPHAHIMLTTRDLGAADWGRKRRDWNARDVLSDLRSDWAQHANLALERAGFDERIDHRSNHARGIYLEPDSYNPHVASHARRQGEIAREANRCSDVADDNALYLQQHPEHILVVVQAQRAVFTRGDIVAAFEDRLMLTETELAGLVAEAMGSGAAVRLVQNSPDGQAQYVTTARASEMQRLEILARAMAIAGPVAGSGRSGRADRARHRSVGRQRPDAGSAGGRASDAVAGAADAGKRLCGNRQDLHAGRGGAGLAGARLRGSGRRSLGQGDAGAWRLAGHADRVTGGLGCALVAG